MSKYKTKKMKEEEQKVYNKMCDSIIYFIEIMWGLTPQKMKPENIQMIQYLSARGAYDEIRPDFYQEFKKDINITWQQNLILQAVERAANGKSKRRISVRSGRGIGKSTVMSWILLWFLFSRYQSNINCTAPNQKQMYDVLWKECAKWLEKMPEPYKSAYIWSKNYIRVSSSPNTWFASAKTARKEAPEALAGLHADDSAALADEASGIHDEIFDTMEGSLTDKEPLIVMISNPTRLIGYFYRSHHQNKDRWQALHFNSEESPIVHNIAENISADYGKDSDQYRIHVLGEFPKEDAMDDKGYVSLLHEDDLHLTSNDSDEFISKPIMGVDPAGEGKNKTVWVVRDQYRAKIVHSEDMSKPKKVAEKTMTLAHKYGIKPENICIDVFGVGFLTVKELALNSWNIEAANVSDNPEDDLKRDIYSNKKALYYFRLKKFLRNGGELVNNPKWRQELMSIRYRRTIKGKLQMMSKREMFKEGLKSPDCADALSLTFFKEMEDMPVTVVTKKMMREEEEGYDQDFASSTLHEVF